jgi:diketogulonate reductase-like aldo/keto reductase
LIETTAHRAVQISQSAAKTAVMKSRQFGNSRHDVSVMGQGTWYIDRGDRQGAVAAIRSGIELGMTHIDTAEMYGDAELVIADAIAERRDDVFLVSKVLPSNASRRGTITACERSLKRLKTDRLDCYLLHWRGSYPLSETVAAFDELVRAGKIRSWGVSNFDVDDLDELLDVAGDGSIACNQVLYHLQERAIEHALIPWCERHGVAVVAYSPFATTISPRRAARRAVCWKKSRRPMARPRARSRSHFSLATFQCSRFQKHRQQRTPPTMPRREMLCSATATSPRSMRRFPAGQSRATCRCCRRAASCRPIVAAHIWCERRPAALARGKASRWRDAAAARYRRPYLHIGVLFSDVVETRDNRF